MGLSDNTVTKYALGYVYNLSKRTAVYTTVAVTDNGTGRSPINATAYSLAGAPAGLPPVLGGKSKGAEFGVRHFF